MPDLQTEIRDWLHQQQDWLQEAAEKLLSSGSVAEVDVQTLVERLKSPVGREVTTHRTFDGLGASTDLAGELRLVEIGNISGIENLGPRRPLSFGTGNLAVIYGHNGSGKSGYTRILKKACGKPRATDLMSNVFQDPPPKRQCTIAYRLAGTDQSVEWQANDEAVADIRSIDIFDADSATVYLRQEATASYTPPEVSFFEALPSVIEQVNGNLKEEQKELVSALPSLPPEYAATGTGTAYTTLSPDLTDDAIQRLTLWGNREEQELAHLTERIKADDPGAEARKQRTTKVQLDQLMSQLKNAAAAVGVEGVESISNTRKAAQDKRQIATESAKIDSAQLDGVGTDTWNALWQAARAYSQTVYPGQDFPVTEDDARCVLCQQELTPDTQQRLHEFEAFVQGTVEAEAKAAEGAYKTALEGLPTIPNSEDIRTRCEAAGLSEDGWPETLEDFWTEVGKARACLVNGEVEEEASPAETPLALLKEMEQRSAALDHAAAQNDEDSKGFDREKAGKDKLYLEARRWTAQQTGAINLEIDRLRKVKEYDEWKQQANSRNTSRKAGEIAERVITQAYVDRFNRELKALGASRIKIELIKARTERGKALHKLRLKGAHSGQDLPESVLSEGERRIVALAAFLADVAEKPHPAPFIFDDPISSLDHDFEWHVATRLVRLAKSRQVLVFTHRLSLYGAMEDAAKKLGEDWKKTHLEQRCIESFDGIAGHPADEAVWNANTKKANNILITRLQEAKRAGESTGADTYRIHAQAICTEFRKLLERTVEDDLLNQIVRRHRRSITTDNRLSPLPKIAHEDCKFIDDLMTKYSCYEHSQSQEAPSFLPDEPELREDLESLKRWREDFKNRPAPATA